MSSSKPQQTLNLLAQAAEAKIYKQGDIIIKDRVSKGYRHPILDKKMIKQRTKREKSILEKANKLIDSPLPEQNRGESIIRMPFIEGKKLSDSLEQLNWRELCKQIGNNIAILHDNNIIHGDLTTSNMILVDNSKNKSNSNLSNQKLSRDIIINKYKKDQEAEQHSNVNKENQSEPSSSEANNKQKVIFIDFGLSFISNRIEDKAVDLHLIKQALEAKHFTIHKEAEKIILENYNSKDKSRVIEQLKKVELRGRYRKNAV